LNPKLNFTVEDFSSVKELFIVHIRDRCCRGIWKQGDNSGNLCHQKAIDSSKLVSTISAPSISMEAEVESFSSSIEKMALFLARRSTGEPVPYTRMAHFFLDRPGLLKEQKDNQEGEF
jgi:hypothetical protein